MSKSFSSMNVVPEIVEITEEMVPSVIGLDADSNVVIGAQARDLGLNGRTNTYHFKTELGKPQDDSQFQARTDRLGRKIPAKPKPYWVRDPDSSATKSFTPLEAVKEYLGALIPKGESEGKTLILGEPTLEEQWRENFKRNMRHVVAELGFKEVLFFPEPFAVYQYYRHIERKIPDKRDSQTVLVVDFGGGTFDCCVIKTTKSGELARSGAHSQPLGFQSSTAAGEAIDIELLKIIKGRAKAKKILFKDDPVERARNYPQSLWAVENIKIALSEDYAFSNRQDNLDFSLVRQDVLLPAGTFHPDQDIQSWLSLQDLCDVTSRLWKRLWGKTVLSCHRAAEAKLGSKIARYDVILLAGGSAHLPMLNSLVLSTLPNQISEVTQLVIGGQAGAAVAKGIAVECREQSDRRPELISDRLATCFLSDLYMRIGRKKSERIAPKVRDSNQCLKNAEGLVYQAPGILENDTIAVTLECGYQLKGVLHYWFHGQSTCDDDALNFISTTVRIPGEKYIDKKFGLVLEVKDDGTITPHFQFKRQGRPLEPVSGQPFNLGDQKVYGNSYLGVDFGTCNSYVASYLIPEREYVASEYPEYEITRETTARLIALQESFQDLVKRGEIDTQRIMEHAKNNELEFVFHSNKIEGNKLTRGQTEKILSFEADGTLSVDKREAINLRNAYQWVLENHRGALDNFSAFCRHVNGILLEGIEANAGCFRNEDVRINGVEYQPPVWGSVSDFMTRLTEEIRETLGRTSGLELAVRAHTKLAAIHPFIDGNGRTARLSAAAIMLSHELPILVLNSDDKERYLDALSNSNAGIMDSLASLFSELLESSMASIMQREVADSHVEKSVVSKPHNTSRPPKLADELSGRSVGLPASGIDSGPKLVELLKKKGDLRRRQQGATYQAWRAAFEMFRGELTKYLEYIDGLDEFRNAGYSLRVKNYDLVNEQRFEAFWTRQDLSKTWFCSFEIENSIERSALMFQFACPSDGMKSLVPNLAPVSCGISIAGQKPGIWLPLKDEPIRLREIGYSEGELIFQDFDGNRMSGSMVGLLEDLVTELLSTQG